MSKLRYVLRETLHMARVGKRWWLTPLVLVFLLFAVVAVFTEGSALLPLIYTLF